MYSRKVLAISTILLPVFAVGCTSAPSPSSQDTADPQTVVTQTGGMPFDAIASREVDALDGLILDAQLRCASAQGVKSSDDKRPNISSTFALPPNIFGSVTEAEARTRGMLKPPRPLRIEIPPRPSPSDAEILGQCYDDVMAKLPKETKDLLNSGIQIVNDAAAAFSNNSREIFDKNYEVLTECAATKGWKPVSSAGKFNDEITLEEYFGVRVGSYVTSGSVQEYQPLPEEIDLAVTLAECRRDLKVYDRSIAESREIQQKYVDANAPALLDFKSRINEALKTAQNTLK